jgi:predicted amino acid dehydrogenase
MHSFAFIIHPLDPKADVARKYPWLARTLPEKAIHFLSRLWPPLVLSQIRGVQSAEGRKIEGWLLACPLTARQMLHLPLDVVLRKIVQTGRLAERLGASVLGLGAYASAVGDGGLTVARSLEIPVTTGHSYTVAVAIRTLLNAGRRMGITPEQATIAVVGATGAIGSTCTRLLASHASRLILVGRRESRLLSVAERVDGVAVALSTEVDAIKEADLIISATNASRPVIYSEHLKAGAVICDVALPRDVSPGVAQQRNDVLVVDGGLVEVPGEVDFGFNYGLPAGLTYGCMAEAMALALEGRFEDYTLGKELRIEKVREIEQVAERHGFRLAGFRSFNQPVTDSQIEAIRHSAARATGYPGPSLASEVTQ